MEWHEAEIDECIAPLVDSLNKAGIYTVSCCCGHGRERGHIWLRDGRVFVIMPATPSKDEVVEAIGRDTWENDRFS